MLIIPSGSQKKQVYGWNLKYKKTQPRSGKKNNIQSLDEKKLGFHEPM